MPTLQVSNFPADVFNEISAQALRENVSFEQEIIALLKSSLPSKISANRSRRKIVLDKIKAMPEPACAEDFDVVAAIKEIRREREKQIYDCRN